MCGIAGIWRPAGASDRDAPALARMVARLHHRGPDGSGRHLDPRAGLALGHARLSIIDLSETGTQPLVARDLALAINGELYDYKPARARLSCAGARFSTKTDSEIALHLYRERGLDFVRALRGEFAIALWDGVERRLVLARDRFGVRPLYYRLTPDAVLFGSEIKAILAHPDVPRRVDLRAALHQMMQTMVPGMTLFEGIRALEPGTMLVLREHDGRLVSESVRYWDLDYPVSEDHDPHPEPAAYVERTREALLDAVRVRLEADVPVGCYLSGGIDSASILGLSTAMQQSPVKAFTISFDHDAYDEAHIAEEMAARTGADHEILRLRAADLYGDAFRRTVWHSERTFYNTLGVAKWHMSRRVQACRYKVVVTGEGADEMFGGYPFFKRDYFLHAPEAAGAATQGHAVFQGAILSERAVEHPAFNDLVGFTPSWIQPWMLTLEVVRPLFADAHQEVLADYDPIAEIAGALDPAQLRGRHPLDKVQYTWIKTMLEGQILAWGGDRVDMANAMESRPPFLDHELAEMARRVPPSLRIRDGVEKWVLREAMKGVLTRSLYEREKFAFMAPPAHTDPHKQRAVEELVQGHLGRTQVEEAGLFDPDRVETFLEGHRRQGDPVLAKREDIVLNHLLCLHILHQTLIREEPAHGPRARVQPAPAAAETSAG